MNDRDHLDFDPHDVFLMQGDADAPAHGVVVSVNDALSTVRDSFQQASSLRNAEGAEQTLVFRRLEDDYFETTISTGGDASLDIQLPMRSGWWIFTRPFKSSLDRISQQELEEWLVRYFELTSVELAEALRRRGAV